MDATTAAAGAGRTAPAHEFGAGRLALADGRMALAVLNFARYRALQMVGVPREQANIVSLVLALTAADATYEAARRLMRTPPLPAAADTAVGAIALREAVLGVAGPTDPRTPLVGSLLVFAAVGGMALPLLRRTTTRLRAAEQRLRAQRISRYRAAQRATAR